MRKLSETNRERVADLLCERLVFERASTRLYDRVVAGMKASADLEVHALQATAEEHRDEELEHAAWLERQVRALGADSADETECSRLARREAAGLEEIAADGAADLTQLLHALLAAQAVGAAGWELLVELANAADDREARRELSRRLHHERDHAAFVRHLVERLAVRAILGERWVVDRALERGSAAYPP